MSLENSDTYELQDRAEFLIKKYVESSLELAKHLEEFGRMRKELQLIITELTKRGVEIKLDDEWTKKVTDQEERLRAAAPASS